MTTFGGGRHEHGQNYLIDHTIIDHLTGLVAAAPGPIVEIGPGRGALTFGLQELGRPLTAVEIDGPNARWLSARLEPHVELVHGDFLRHRLPARPHTLIGNLPFHLTTAMLRKILHTPHWDTAVLLVQWEVARRRAGIGGATMMTAQWWPWIEFDTTRRVSARAFRPAPSVDGGVLVLRRRPQPLIDVRAAKDYRAFVHRVFTGRGRGLAEILPRATGAGGVSRWLDREGIPPRALPRELTAGQWARLYETYSDR